MLFTKQLWSSKLIDPGREGAAGEGVDQGPDFARARESLEPNLARSPLISSGVWLSSLVRGAVGARRDEGRWLTGSLQIYECDRRSQSREGMEQGAKSGRVQRLARE